MREEELNGRTRDTVPQFPTSTRWILLYFVVVLGRGRVLFGEVTYERQPDFFLSDDGSIPARVDCRLGLLLSANWGRRK